MNYNINMIPQKTKTFKQSHTLEKRIQIFEQNKKNKSANTVVVILQRDHTCKGLPDIKYTIYSIINSQKMMEVFNAIKTKLNNIDKKYEKQPLFLFTKKILLNHEHSLKEVYATQKDPEDGLLYITYSNINPF